jgi:hypothetical protein
MFHALVLSWHLSVEVATDRIAAENEAAISGFVMGSR